jgi:glycosyltransferase involved in cell wall biosynthesis
MEKKPRILYIAWTPPSTASGACLAMRRHLIERSDFETMVLTNQPFTDTRVECHSVLRPAWLERAMRTRFRRLIRQLEMLFLGRWMLPKAMRLAREFKPDLVLTIPDNDVSWCAYLTARRLKLPLVTNFQDWWPSNQYWSESERPFSAIRRIVERRFHHMYTSSELAFCTSEGMMQFLGEHPNAVILLPCPGRGPTDVAPAHLSNGERPLRVVYAGTISGDYGRMVLALAKLLADSSEFQFLVCGPWPDWRPDDIAWAKAQGIYHGFIPHDELRTILASADVFLTVMSFDRRLEIMSRVSFTTKFLEYVQYRRPIVVWGPPYCQPVRVAQATQAGLPVIVPDAVAVVAGLKQLSTESEYTRLATAANHAASALFAPDYIHEIFRANINAILKQSETAQINSARTVGPI